jgi:diadenosine tetraphosphatase ApaH/serine/threonine PP2A family protein phosphatase
VCVFFIVLSLTYYTPPLATHTQSPPPTEQGAEDEEGDEEEFVDQPPVMTRQLSHRPTYEFANIAPLTASADITRDWVSTMMDELQRGRILHAVSAVEIAKRLFPVFKSYPNVLPIGVSEGATITVVGDIHGQLDDLMTIFKLNGTPSVRNKYLFNGDIVDRGANSLECLCIIMAWKVCVPDGVFINRGNHEARDINSRDGFEKECIYKYGLYMFDLWSRLFAALPLASTINSNTFVVHGGLFWEDNVTVQKMNAVNRFHQIPIVNSLPEASLSVFDGHDPAVQLTEQQEAKKANIVQERRNQQDPPHAYLESMLWSDPVEGFGRVENSRGAGLEFGEDVCDDFMALNGFSLILRSHECVDYGYQSFYGGKLVTLFSASNYCGVYGNDGAFCILSPDKEAQFVRFSARPQGKHNYNLLEDEVLRKLLIRITNAISV